MPNQNYPLVQLGPFNGLDATTDDVYVQPGDGIVTQNSSPSRKLQGLVNEYGRQNIYTFPNSVFSGLNPTFIAVAPMVTSATDELYFVSAKVAAAFETAYYDPATGHATAINGNNKWTQAVQFFDTLYFNNGEQFNIANSANTYQWQYVVPPSTRFTFADNGDIITTTTTNVVIPNTTLGTVAIGITPSTIPNGAYITLTDGTNSLQGYVQSGGLAATITVVVLNFTLSGATINSGSTLTAVMQPGQYNYAFTYTVTGPNGGFIQETTPIGATLPFLFSKGKSGFHALTITGPFSGTYSDGATWTTNIYRQSALQPVWFQVATGITGTTYTDVYTDVFISQNAELDFNQDPPPISGNLLAPIANYKNRMWVFVALPPPQIGTLLTTANRGPNQSTTVQLVLKPTVPFNLAPYQNLLIDNGSNQEIVQTLANTSPYGASGNAIIYGNFAKTHSAGTPVYQYQKQQCQLWFSAFAEPYSFDATNVLLVEDDFQTFQSPNTYGSAPVALVPTSSYLYMLKSDSLWATFGDDETSFTPRKIYDVGCIAPFSPATYLGQMFWLAENGVWMFDGSFPNYISEPIREALNAIPLADQQNSVGFFRNKTYYLSFPATGITFCYYTITGKWRTLPYATNAAFYVPSSPASFSGATQYNEVVAVRTGTSSIDWWFAGGENDLGQPITLTWTSPFTDSGEPKQQKQYDYITLEAPFQNATATVTFTIDPNGPNSVPPFTTQTINLSGESGDPGSRETRHIVRIPGETGQNRGYLAQVSVTATNVKGATAPIVIHNVTVWGQLYRELAIPTAL